MAKLDPAVLAHLEWLGFVQPTGLVVSAPALVRAGANLQRNDTDTQRGLRELVVERSPDPKKDPVTVLPDFRSFASTVLGWSFSAKAYAGTDESPVPDELQFIVEGDLVTCDFAVRELEPQSGRPEWQLLVRELETGAPFDRAVRRGGSLEMSEHSRMERLLRKTGVAAGLLFNGTAIRLLSAPSGESSGWLDFSVADMLQTAGRPIATAMKLLLSQERLLALPRQQRLAALLDDSRKFQNEVSERLAEQVLHALYELLRGFQHANDRTKGDLLRYTLADHPDEIYRGLLTVLLRLVFLKYAEERGMLPKDEVYLPSYSLGGLYERLREDAALYPDTMNERYGAWVQLLALFRIVHDGADAGKMQLPKRHGVLFDPDRYPFLEGRFGSARQIHERIDPPLVPDGTVWRVLEKLLVLEGERISYRALDVEQIGSVYETMMGFRLERTTGPSVAIKAAKKQGAPTGIDLEELLGAGDMRDKWISERTDRKLTDRVKKDVKAAQTIDELHAALAQVIDRAATPDLVPSGSMVLQPSEERRRSGSHYTPRSLTEPIVRTTLEPILMRLRGEGDRPPKPEQILELKVCDPAMGSGAFLVEACRQIGDALVESWHAHDAMPQIPPDEDEVVHARRLVAQRCLYGVDRNPMAVDLAKVSLWLVTLAKEHSLTFVDHALRHGDSLVGLSRRQLEAFHWDDSQPLLKGLGVREPLDRYLELRRAIREAGDEVTDRELNQMWSEANRALTDVRFFGDLVVFAFFEGQNARERETRRTEYASAALRGKTDQYRDGLRDRRVASPPLAPFHWHIEFPEVFVGKNGGFDAFVGNPPYAGNKTLADANIEGYSSSLRDLYANASGRTDLVAFFFRRGFELSRQGGTLGFLATNTIAQGDTRRSGLAHICRSGGIIYAARKRVNWSGSAAVVTSIVWVAKELIFTLRHLNGRPVSAISPYLLPVDVLEPSRLFANMGHSALGCKPGDSGFVVEGRELSTLGPIEEGTLAEYVGGSELNDDPRLRSPRAVFKLGLLDVGALGQYPLATAILKARLRGGSSKTAWWTFAHTASGMMARASVLPRVLAKAEVSSTHALAFKDPNRCVFSNKVIVFCLDDFGSFSVLQSRIHEEWSRVTSGTMKDDPSYVPADSFDPFPFPHEWRTTERLAAAGSSYYEFRAELMVRNNEGLTKTYNRFHDPEERDPDILKLRELHAAMDRTVLDAYGWNDIRTECDFLLDYEIDEEGWGSKKKPYRYRWPEDVRDEVLARLLELNAERAREEARSGAAAVSKKPQKGKLRQAAGAENGTEDAATAQNTLFKSSS